MITFWENSFAQIFIQKVDAFVRRKEEAFK